MENQETVLQKLKRVVIKEELVALTGDIFQAVILNQFLYWSERIKDFDKFISEEKVRAERHGENIVIDLQNGWIYKTAEELVEETMLGISAVTMRSHIKKLVGKGYLLERTNPLYKWDKTKQYRVELNKIDADLLEIGYVLQGYKTETKISSSESKKIELRDKESLVQNKEILDCNSNSLGAIPETTTEITFKEDRSFHQAEKENDGQMDLSDKTFKGVEMEDSLSFKNKEELLDYLKNKHGATEAQIIRGIRKTKELEDQGKVKNFWAYLSKVIETVKTDDLTKGLATLKGGDQAADEASLKKKRLLESLYQN